MTHWYHPACGAFTRPDAFLEALAACEEVLPDRATLESRARLGATHRRLPRVRAAGRAPSGRAACRHCREPIAQGAWRIALAYYEEGRFVPSGYIHARCARPYLETGDVLDRLRHFSPGLTTADAAEVAAELAG